MTPDSTDEPTPTGSNQGPEDTNRVSSPADESATPVPVTFGSSTPAASTPEPAAPTQPAAISEPQVASSPTEPTPQPATPTSAQPSVTSPAQPNQAVIMGGTAGSPVTFQPTAMGSLPKKRRPLKWIIALVAAIVVVGGGYTFAFYLPNTPGNIYKYGLTDTNKAYDKLLDYVSTTQTKHYKGYTADGSFKVTSASGSGDGTFSAASDGSNGQGQVSVDIFGEKLDANYRSVLAKGQTTPDVYLQMKGIKTMLDGFGLKQLDSLDGQWIGIDHTIIETGLAQTSGANAKKETAPSYNDAMDAMKKLGEVNKKYLFTTDSKTAVLKEEKYLGKSTQDGRTVAGYQVGYDKAHLKAYVKAAGDALDGSGLGAWVKKTTGKTISQGLALDEAGSSIDRAKSDYTFNMYVDTKTKLIHKVHFADTKDPVDNYLEVGFNYVGGSKYPFVFDLHDKDGGTTTTANVALTLDSDTNEVTATINGSTKDSSATTFTLNMTAKPSNAPLNVTAPKGAKSITSILNSLGLGGLLGGGSSAGSGSVFGGV